ncbi:hypothetical protein [Campylobacter canadensis]|uniref:Uncharacterized protein n=1 Tax=Campylobacter canadensis TaxID=449520 RepID=A0ABS7WRE9_9BACT|nr:hypothetical protein [Campylobacter canadensis]MBZ7987330.1 hypothetical protein [Campylobacter canadensis]MBZ7998499.1 hypothetical protein [Campylobacter canadensis]
MSRKNNKRDIIAYDINSNKLYRLANNILNEITIKDKTKTAYNISYMPGLEVKYSSVDVSNESDEDEINVITNKIYESLGLDIDKDYNITYGISNASMGVNTIYNVFVVDNEKIAETFDEVAKKINYIDYLDMEPLLYKTYYSNQILDSMGLQMFIYLHKTYATLTFYKDGELIYYRVLNKLSIDMLHAAYCNDLSERISERIFIDDLNRYGFDHIEEAKKISLNKVLADAFKLLVSNISFGIKTLSLADMGISRVIVGTDIGLSDNFLRKIETMFSCFRSIDPDELIDRLLENNIEINSNTLRVNQFLNIHKFKYDLFKNTKEFIPNIKAQENTLENVEHELNINPFVLMSFLKAQEQLKEPMPTFNISTYLRPLPLLKRRSGQLILTAVLALLLAILYPIFNYSYGYYLSFKSDTLSQQLPSVKETHDKLSQQISGLKSQIDSLNQNINQSKQRYSYIANLLDEIYNKKQHYYARAKMVKDLTGFLNVSNVKITTLEANANTIELGLKGGNIEVANFLNSISSVDKYSIDSKDINIQNIINPDGSSEYVSKVVIRVVK